MTGPHGKSTRRYSRRELFQSVMTLLRRKMQQAGYTPVLIEGACTAWERFFEISQPQIRSVQAYAAAMEYAVVLRLGGGQITQRAVAERYLVSQASIARLHPRILNCLATAASSNSHRASSSSLEPSSSPPSLAALADVPDTLPKHPDQAPHPTKPATSRTSSADRVIAKEQVNTSGSFAKMSRQEQREELAHLQSLPMVRERWGAILLRTEAVAALEQRDLCEGYENAAPLFSSLCVRPRRPSDPETVVLVWMDLSRRRILGWFPTDVAQMAHLWELSLRLVMERPLYGMPRRPVDVVLPAVTPFDAMAQWLVPLEIHLTPLDRQEIPLLESAILGSLCEAPYPFVEENSARYQEDREAFFALAARVALDLSASLGEEFCLWGKSGALSVSLYPEPVGVCVGRDVLSALWKARSGTTDIGAWWFAWNWGEGALLCWATTAAALGGYLATHLERRGLRLSQRVQIARLVEQLMRFDERHPETSPHNVSEGQVVWELRFQRGAVLPAALRRHLFEEGYEIAHARAFPMLCVRDLVCGLLPFTEYLWPAVNGFLADWDARCGAILREQPASLALDILPAERKEHTAGFASLLSL